MMAIAAARAGADNHGQHEQLALHATMDSLPAEIIYNITTYLEPVDIVTLQLVCRRLLTIARDERLWREQCFQRSPFLHNLRRREELISSAPAGDSRFRDLQRALAAGNGLLQSRHASNGVARPSDPTESIKAQATERIRLMANWDPSYPHEKVDWFSEYIRREGPISVSWLQQPQARSAAGVEYLDIRGMGLFHSPPDPKSTLVVAPLDDGSVCLWDLTGSNGRKGSIVARSAPGVLAAHMPAPHDLSKRSSMIYTGVTECVSIDSYNRKAYVAVQNAIVEIDLETLQPISHERFPFSISALSEAKLPTPITVGTTLSLHLYDPRARLNATLEGESTSLDRFALGPSEPASNSLSTLLNPLPRTNYAPLYQPGPLSIAHIPSAGDDWNGNGDIYVAGRFPSILNYDRRTFPRLRGTIYSGARLCSLAGLPFPFVSMDKDLMRRGELSVEQVNASKSLPGKTLIACGEYNSKGSLEMYGLSPISELSNVSSDSSAGKLQQSTLKNRQTSSSSKLLSVSNHGTSVVFADGSGNLAWFERDGVTEIRRWNIGHGTSARRGLFGPTDDDYLGSGSGDIVRKILSTHRGDASVAVNSDDLVLWTGEKLGLLGFSSQPGFTTESFEEQAQSLEELHRARDEREYGERMRRLLERQADEARFVQGLGLGFHPSRSA